MSESSVAARVGALNSEETFDANYDDESIPMLDVFLAQKAQEFGKKLHSIETPAEQCNPLYSIDQNQVII